MQESARPAREGSSLAMLALLALGVIYGDIGTSPLYALRECFHGAHGVAADRANVLGVLSLIFWTLVIVVTLKYHLYVIRADNRGEGGILAMVSLVGSVLKRGRLASVAIALGLFGAALLYADGALTPAISVLSAVEGLSIATSIFDPYILPITLVVLVGLFMVQHHGTGGIGSVFGPIMIVWFGTLAVLGIWGIMRQPSVLAAINPWHAVQFFMHNGVPGFVVLGAVFLVATGGEALYADLGHFGEKPVQIDWFCLVGPALALNYFGQGAMLIDNPAAAESPFYLLAPSWALYPLVALATAATIIASQAVITGVFSLTMQAAQLGYIPRVRIDHTSAATFGQVYIGSVNWLLMLLTVGLVLGFRSSSAMAGAYGMAIATTMVITTLLAFPVAWKLWRWPLPLALGVTAVFLVVDIAFFAANTLKLVHGGWFPLVVGMIIFVQITTWKRGRQLLSERIHGRLLPLEMLVKDIAVHPPLRVPGSAVFMTGTADKAPLALVHNLKHNKSLHERVMLLTILTEDVPYVPVSNRAEVQRLDEGMVRIVARFGFMQEPHVPRLLGSELPEEHRLDASQTTFFLGHETLIVSKRPGMAAWRKQMFAVMSRLSAAATTYYHIPVDRVVELGAHVEL